MRFVAIFAMLLILLTIPYVLSAQDETACSFDPEKLINVEFVRSEELPQISPRQSVDALLCLSNNTDNLVELNITINQNGDLQISDEFDLLEDFANNMLRFTNRLDSGNTREIPLQITGGEMRGIIHVDVTVEVNGTEDTDLRTALLIQVGDVQSSEDAVTAQFTPNRQPVDEGIIGSLELILRNTTDSQNIFTPSLRTFTGISLGSETNIPPFILYPGEVRIYDMPVSLQADQNFGRYTIAVSISNDTGVIFEELVPIPDGRNSYDPPLGQNANADGSGLFLDVLAQPDRINLSDGGDGQILVWVENLLSTPEVRSIRVEIQQTTREINFSDAEEANPSYERRSIYLGPQEAVVLYFNYDASVPAGIYSFNIILTDEINTSATINTELSIEFTR